MNKKIVLLATLNIMLLFIIYILTEIGDYIVGFLIGFFGVTEVVSIILSFLIIELIIGWLPYKLFIKTKISKL